MAKICLINPPVRTWSKPNVFPLGLGYLASILSNNGHTVQVLDINGNRFSKKDVVQKIKYSKADVFAITGLVTSYEYILWLIDTIRDYHQSEKIVLGGPLATSASQVLGEKIQDKSVDTICKGEGEEAIVEIVSSYSEECRHPIVYMNKKKPIEPLDKIPFPSWDFFPMSKYVKNPIGGVNTEKWKDGRSKGAPKSMNLIASRGCSYGCLYCYHDFMGYKYRHRSVPNIIAEMEALRERYDIRYFHFVDDEFVLRKDFVHDFCDSMLHMGLKVWGDGITWGCTGNARIMDEDLIKHMAETGCIHISYGIESGSQEVLDWMNKKITVERAKESVLLTEKYIKNPSYTFIVGAPMETIHTIGETVDFCKETGIAPEAVFFLTAYPGTDLYEFAKDFGYITDDKEYLIKLSNNEQGKNLLVNFTDFPDKELVRIKHNVGTLLKAQNS